MRQNPSGLAFRLDSHRLEAPCHVCRLATREGVQVDFPTRARGAAAISRTYGEKLSPDDAAALKPLPMTVEFSCHRDCLTQFWDLISERGHPGDIGAR